MIRFEHEYYFYLLLILPVLVLVHWSYKKWRSKTVNQLSPAVQEGILGKYSYPKLATKSWLSIIGIASLIFGLANLQFGSKVIEAKREGIDLMIALDVSNSMLTKDTEPNRMERSKLIINRIIDQLKGDRIGLVVFAGDAFVQLPITSDYSAARLFLKTVNTDMFVNQGTAIAKAVDLCVESFGESQKNNQAILLITDGENHEEGAIEAVEQASAKNIPVYCIGMGTTNGGPIPINAKGDFRKDKEGNSVISALNVEMLQEIAAKGKGQFFLSQDATSGINQLFEELSTLEKASFESELYEDYEDRHQWFIGLALVLFIIEILINVFNKKDKKKWLLFG